MRRPERPLAGSGPKAAHLSAYQSSARRTFIPCQRTARKVRSAWDRLRIVPGEMARRFFGSAGLRTLSESAEQAAHEPGFQPLRVVVDHNRPVVRPIEITGLDRILALYYDVAGALTATNPE